MSKLYTTFWPVVHILLLCIFVAPDATRISLECRRYVNVVNLLDHHLPYSSGWDLQLDLMQHHMQLQDQNMKAGSIVDDVDICIGTVIFCQHSSTYTLGSATTQGSGPFSKILADGSSLEYETFTVERAGQATYHGPGQLVVYPILDLGYFSKDIHLYLRGLEQTIIDTLDHFDIASKRIEGLTGVWTVLPDGRDSKIAALGIKLRRWVTMHGLSINVCPDMRYFDNIVPCGITDKSVTSMQQLGCLHPNDRAMRMSTNAAMTKASDLFFGVDIMGEVSSALLQSLSVQFGMECHALSKAEADTFVSHITDTYGPLRPNYICAQPDLVSVTRDEVP